MSRWEEAERSARRKAYATIDNDPQILLETDGGPTSIDAEVYIARLFGMDGEIVADGMRLSHAMPVLLVPILASHRSFLDAGTEPSGLLRHAEYIMQSGFALVHLAAEYAPPEVKIRKDFTFTVLYLRYRRRPIA